MSLFRREDPAELRRQIGYLRKIGLYVTRPSQHQIKVGRANWYPASGAIAIDGLGRHPRSGFGALLDIVKPDADRPTTRALSNHTSAANDNLSLQEAAPSLSWSDIFAPNEEDIDDDPKACESDCADEPT